MTWSNVEVGMLARAVNRAPSVHNTQPWVIEIARIRWNSTSGPRSRYPGTTPADGTG
jgi:hypothetical protein